MTAALSVEGLVKTYGGTRAVDGVSLEVRRGEFFALIGPSGCGKTTTLRSLAGLTTPDAGEVSIDGRPVTDRPARERDTNLVFQDLVLFPHMTVAENVAYGLERAGVSGPERDRRVAEMLEVVDLAGFGDRDPAALSGGQRQRVALARALVNEPAVLLLDEPLASLDRSLREELQAAFRRVQRETDTTFLYVTHDQESAMSMADRLAVMRRGRVVDVGRPERLYERPRTAFVADFLGEATLLEGTVTAVDGREARVDTPAGDLAALANGVDPVPGDPATVVVRPEAVTVGEGALAGRVVDRAYKGFYEEATVELDGGARLTVRGTGERAPAGAVEPSVPTDGGDHSRRFGVGDRVELAVGRAVLVEREAGEDGDG